MTRRWRSVE